MDPPEEKPKVPPPKADPEGSKSDVLPKMPSQDPPIPPSTLTSPSPAAVPAPETAPAIEEKKLELPQALKSEDSASTAASSPVDVDEVSAGYAKKPVAPITVPNPRPTDVDLQSPLSPVERIASYNDLRAYEAKRRAIYLSKLKSSSLYWRSFRELLSKSYQETERAESLIRGSLVANEAYAQYLKAAAEDRLDYAGRPLDERKAKKVQDDKQRKYHTLGGGSLLLGVAMKDPDDGIKDLQKVNAATDDIKVNVSYEGLPEKSLLNSLIEGQENMASKFMENVAFVKDVAQEKIILLRKELETEVNVMSMLGDVTIHELEKAEDDVQKAWAAYYTLASMTMGSAVSPRTHNEAKAKVMDPNAVTCVWLVEMHYRMSVAYLTTVWEKSSAELSNLFASMKELECNRRFRLTEILIAYMQRSERLWLSIPAIITDVMKDLVSTPTDSNTIERDVQESIRDKAQQMQKEDDARFTPDPMNGPGLAGGPPLKEGYELQSPLLSDLISKSEVIWRKSEKLMSVWKPALAVTTTDSYLHLFEIPHYSNVQTGTAPEVAFQALVRPVKIPTEEDLVEGNYPMHGSSWYNNLIPTDSIDLKNAKISFSEMKGNSTFELTETLTATGLSKIAKAPRRKRLNLRMYSSQHMVEWLLCLKAFGAE